MILSRGSSILQCAQENCVLCCTRTSLSVGSMDLESRLAAVETTQAVLRETIDAAETKVRAKEASLVKRIAETNEQLAERVKSAVGQQSNDMRAGMHSIADMIAREEQRRQVIEAGSELRSARDEKMWRTELLSMYRQACQQIDACKSANATRLDEMEQRFSEERAKAAPAVAELEARLSELTADFQKKVAELQRKAERALRELVEEKERVQAAHSARSSEQDLAVQQLSDKLEATMGGYCKSLEVCVPSAAARLAPPPTPARDGAYDASKCMRIRRELAHLAATRRPSHALRQSASRRWALVSSGRRRMPQQAPQAEMQCAQSCRRPLTRVLATCRDRAAAARPARVAYYTHFRHAAQPHCVSRATPPTRAQAAQAQLKQELDAAVAGMVQTGQIRETEYDRSAPPGSRLCPCALVPVCPSALLPLGPSGLVPLCRCALAWAGHGHETGQ